MIQFVKGQYIIIGADEYLQRVSQNELDANMVALSFDDGLLCQYDVALPVLESYGLSAFWFIYTLPLEDGHKGDRLEIYHDFRFTKFLSVDDFYDAFFSYIKKSNFYEKYDLEKEFYEFVPEKYFPDRLFYTYNDRLFRYIRSEILHNDYFIIMDDMMKAYEYDPDNVRLWMDSQQLKELDLKGHVVGLHTHSHNTNLTSLTKEEQKAEWSINRDYYQKIIGHDPYAVSYPCGRYNEETISIVKELGICMGFADHYQEGSPFNVFSLNRIDSTDVLRLMKEG